MKRKKKPVFWKKRFVVPAAVAGVAAAGVIAYRLLFSQTAYTVARVIDGDTFQTSTKQIYRIYGLELPG